MTGTTDKQQFPLIAGAFSPDDAQEVLMNLIEDKITFHQRSNLRRRERFGDSDPAREKRIGELRASKAAIAGLIEDSRRRGLRLAIRCDIEIVQEAGD